MQLLKSAATLEELLLDLGLASGGSDEQPAQAGLPSELMFNSPSIHAVYFPTLGRIEIFDRARNAIGLLDPAQSARVREQLKNAEASAGLLGQPHAPEAEEIEEIFASTLGCGAFVSAAFQ